VAISANELKKIPGARRTSGTRKSRTRKSNTERKWPQNEYRIFHARYFVARKEKDGDYFDVYKDFARCGVL
jgi:hypothetical protein